MPSTSHSLLTYLRVVVGVWRNDPRNDAELLVRFAESQDEGAFATLVWRHGLLVWRTCRRILGDTPDAEDAFQATFLALARKAGQFPVTSLAGWLHRVARQAAMDVQSKSRRNQDLERRLQAVSKPEVEDSPDRTELYAALDEELAGVPERLRVPLVLRYLEGKTQDEVARILGCSRSVALKRLARGEAILRERLERRGLGMGVVSVGALLGSTITAPALPARLISGTARAAVAFRSGTLTGGAAEAARAVLGALPASLLPASFLETTIMRKSLWIMLACCLGLGGAALVTCRALSARLDEPVADGPAVPQAAKRHSQDGAKQTRTDRYGDPLPPNALARMGTVRLFKGARNYDSSQLLAFSPDGKLFASHIYGTTVVALWDAATGKEIRRFTSDAVKGEIASLDFSPDGKTLVTAWHQQPRGQTVYCWEVTTSKLLRTRSYQNFKEDRLYGPGKVAFLSDGRMLVVGELFIRYVDAGQMTFRRGICVWDVTTSKGVRELSDPAKRRESYLLATAFSPDGKLLAAAWDNSIILWDMTTGKEIHRLPLDGTRANQLVFSRDGKRLAVADSQTMVSVWDVATGKPLRRLKVSPHQCGISLTFSPDSKILIGGQEGHLWETSTGKAIRRLWEVNRPGKSAQPIGKTSKEIHSLGVEYGNARHGALFSPDGKILALGDDAGVIHLWDTATGKEKIFPHPGHQGRIWKVAYSPDGKILASKSEDGTIRLWEVATGKEIRQLHIGWSSGCMAYSPNDKILATAEAVSEHSLTVWDTASGKAKCKFERFCNGKSVAFSPDGKLLAAAGGTINNAGPGRRDGVVLFEVATGREVFKLVTESKPRDIMPLAFSPDGRLLATPGPENEDSFTVSLWDVATGKTVGQLSWLKPLGPQRNNALIRVLAFSPSEGDRVLATSSDGESNVRLWEVASGKEIGQPAVYKLRGVEQQALYGCGFTFSPDGRMIATVPWLNGNSNEKLAVTLWDVATGKKIGRLVGHRSCIESIAFSPDGKTLASGSDDLTCLIWDVAAVTGQPKPVASGILPRKPLSKDQLEAAWTDLISTDAAKAYRAISALRATPEQAVHLLQARVRPAAPIADAKQLARWITDLDNESFMVRQKAQRAIKSLGEPAIPTLRRALAAKPSLEVRRRLQEILVAVEPKLPTSSPERLGEIRAVQVLESIATPEAQQILQTLAKGIAEVSLTREAQAARERLARRPAPRQ